VVLMTAMSPRLGTMFWRERKHRDLLQAGYTIIREAQARIARLNIGLADRVVLAEDPAEAVLAELARSSYDLLVLGGVMRSSEQGISLGRTVERLLHSADLPRVRLPPRAGDAVSA
jgi:nucleotide-binding universal stress UspA family protein